MKGINRPSSVSLCMIVRNEESSLAAGLSSVVDLVDEVVVVDTGSVDRTKDIALRYGAKVYDFAWCDDFAAARNESLRHARGDWIFWLDGDEWLDDANRSELRSLFAGLGQEMRAYSMCQLCLQVSSLPGGDGGFDQRVEQVRLFPNHPEIRWSYRVFEQIFGSVRQQGGDVQQTNVVIHHSGYQDAGQHRRKIERNLRLAELDLRDRPDDAYVLYTLGIFHQMLGQHAESVPPLRAGRERLAPQTSYGAKLHALLVQAHERLGQTAAAWEVNQAGRSLFPEDDELRFQEATLREQTGDLRGAEAAWRDLEERLAPAPAWQGERRRILVMVRQNLTKLLQRQGRWGEAEVRWRALLAEQPDWVAAWLQLGEVYISLGRPEALEPILQELTRLERGADALALRSRSRLERKGDAAARVLPEAGTFGAERETLPARAVSPVVSAEASPAGFDEARREHQAGNVERAVLLYRQYLLVEPNNAQGWYLLGAALAQLGQLDEARNSLRQATSVNPRHAEAHNHLGVVLGQQASLDEAIASFHRALELKPDSSDVLTNLGLALLRQDKAKDAVAVFQRALELRPGDVKARHNLHRALREQGHFEELLSSRQQAVGPQPESAQAHNVLGLTLYEHGKLDEAAEAFRQALVAKPELAEAHNNLGLVLASQGKLDEAIAAYRRAIVLKPAFAEAHNNLGIALRQSGQAEEAVASCRKAARLKPELPELHNNLGRALEEIGRHEEAIGVLEEALRIKPDFAKAHNNLGFAYWNLGRFDEAVQSCRRAIELMPEMAEAYNNLGNVLRDRGNLGAAEKCYDKAVDLKPNYADPHWNQSLVRLLTGDFDRGWAGYEWRWKLKTFRPRQCPQPLWDGSPLQGKTILLAAEQGLGDTIQFIRYAPLVRQRGAQVLAEIQRPLQPILMSCPGVDRLLVPGEPLPEFDTHITLLSLPRLLGTRVETVPANVPYLKADPALVDKWRDEIKSLPGFKVGIAWKGRPQNRADRGRSLPLALFEVLARVPGVTLVSLQKGPGSEQIAQVADRFKVVEFGERLDAEAPFMDTAAIMQHLDLVISCDSSPAHLAGALGVPVWIALLLTPDWRWLLARDDTPWYPTARLFRQRCVGDWPEVFERMAAALREKV